MVSPRSLCAPVRMLTTPAGSVFHTGDWKLDPDPVVGPAFDAAGLAAVGSSGVLAMVCDSTNALEPGRSVSEGELFENLRELVAAASGRVVVGCFGSNVARLTTLARVARSTGRYAGLLGRSLHNYHRAAMEAGVWDAKLIFADPAHLGYLPRDEVLAIATGSQGEPRTALRRLAHGVHPDMELEPGDTVLMSSRGIPGNEAVVGALLRQLERLGVRVVRDEHLNKPIHASGHPAREELADMYAWVQPQIAIPVHGEAAHLQAHAELARDIGVPQQLLGCNGDLFMLAPQRGIRRSFAEVGRLGLEHNTLVSVRWQ